MTPATAAAITAALRSWFGLSAAETRVLVALWFARGQALPPEELMRLAELTSQGGLCVIICKVRQAMSSEAIDCERGAGYWLSEIGVAEIEEAISDMRAALAEAA